MKNDDNYQLSTVNSPLSSRLSTVNSQFKMTEVGVIPEDWDSGCLGEKVQKVGSGITPTGGERVYKKEGRPFIRSQNVGWGHLLLDDVAFIDDGTHETFQSTEIVIDDVFVNITGASIGRSAVADDRIIGGNVNQHVCIIRTNQGQLHPRFLNYFLLSKLGQQQIDSFQAGGNRQGLNFGQIRSFQLPLPPLHEQRAIATVLSDVDALLAAQDKLIAKKRDIKQAAMQQLLTGKQRLRKTMDSGELIVDNEGNPVYFSGEWEVKRLGDVADIDSDNIGGDTPSDFAFNYISLEDVDIGSLRSYSEQVFSSAPSRARRRLKAGDILVSTVRPNLQSHLLFTSMQPNWVCSTGFSVVRCKIQDAVSGYVFSHIFANGVTKQIEALLTGSNYPAINGGDVRKLEIPLPSIKEQTAIAAVLSDMDADLAALEHQRDKTRAVKLGMMQVLLTGKIRLTAN